MAPKSPPFLMWYDDSPKLSIANKIEEAIAAYADRLGVRPTLVLVNEAELTEFPGVEVRGVTTVRRHTYWVGQEVQPTAPSVGVEPLPAAPTPRPVAAPAKAPTRRRAKATA